MIEAKQYRKFCSKRNSELRLKYYCAYVDGKCIQEKCDCYDGCIRDAKLNYETWKEAYRKDQRTILQQLAKGGITNEN